MTITLPVALRDGTKSIQEIRAAEMIPAVVYGPKQSSVGLTVGRKEFEKLFKSAGESTIIVLEGLVTPIEVLVHSVDFSPTKGGIQHVDFYAVEAGKEITTHVQLEFVGESPIEKVGGMVSKIMHEIEVTCMPSVLPAHITVDVSGLTEIDQKIHVSDVILPKGVTIENDPHDVVALAAAGGAEETAEAPVAA